MAACLKISIAALFLYASAFRVRPNSAQDGRLTDRVIAENSDDANVEKNTMYLGSNREISTEASYASFERHFLQRLGLSSLPTRRSKRSNPREDPVPEYMMEVYRKMQKDKESRRFDSQQPENAAFEDATVLGILPYKVWLGKRKGKAYFHLNASIDSKATVEIVCRQPLRANDSENEGVTSLRVVSVCWNSVSKDHCRALPHRVVSRVREDNNRFYVVDITKSFLRWRNGDNEGRNHSGRIVVASSFSEGATGRSGLDLHDCLLVISNRPKSSPPTAEGLGNSSNYDVRRQRGGGVPRVEIFEELKDAGQGNKRRRRREVGCSLHSWYLDFGKLGWTSWIQFPVGYYANYCSGTCSTSSETSSQGNMTNHAFVKGLYRLALRKETSVPTGTNLEEPPAACCVPVRLSSINILYSNDEQHWIIREMSEMVADHCGCL